MATQNTHYGAEHIRDMLKNKKSIYFIGVGGINMSSLAHLTFSRGYRVGGSDRAPSAITERLEGEGIQIFYSHDAKNIDTYDAVVYTVAISPDNPEYVRATELGLPCISRSDYLGYIMTEYPRRIGISGMHGKSTCTSMCAQTLIDANTDPTVLSGAELSVMGGAYRVGADENFVFEACEYMDSFLDFYPTVAVVLNIEMDHVDYFHSMEQIRRSYARFTSLTGKEGYAVYNCDDADVLDALSEYSGNRISFGIDSEAADLRAVNISCERGKYSFDVLSGTDVFCHIKLSVTGYHNIYNALACVAVCRICGLSDTQIERGLSRFCGARRRMEYKGQICGADIYDDYGHHPTEILATLSGARGLVGDGGRLFCVYQPHTYSRTHALFDDFASALSVADRVITVDIYAAREVNTFGVSSEGLAKRIGHSAVCGKSLQNSARILAEELREGDVAIVMGAGDIFHIYPYLGLNE